MPTRRVPLVAAVALAAAWLPGQADEGDAAVRHWQQRLDALARADGRHETLGPVGRRLWMTRLDARPGCVGQAHYLHHTPELVDPLELTLTDGAGKALDLQVRERQWFPSHATVRYGIDGAPAASVETASWISDDDVFVARITVRGLARIGAQWRSAFAAQPVGDGSRFFAASTFARSDVDVRTGPEVATAADDAPVWFEAETPLQQNGSRGRDRKRAASAGEVLGADFGAQAGHAAVWEFFAGAAGAHTLLVRYARAAAGPAAWRVAVRGAPIGELQCEPTGGWGDTESEFALARVDLGALRAGWCTVQIEALADGANTNFDGGLVVPTANAGAPLPERARWAELDPARGRLALPGGRRDYDGVPFSILPPARPQGARLDAGPLAVAGEGARLHVLALPTGPHARVTCAGSERVLAPRSARPGPQRVTLAVPAHGELALGGGECVVLAVTRERAGDEARDLRRGHATFHGVRTEIRAGLHGLRDFDAATVPAAGLTLWATFECSGDRLAGAATAAALAPADPLAAHRRRYAQWYAANAPRLTARDALLERIWTYRWFLVRHNLAFPEAGNLPIGPVVYEGRHGSWYPRVITFSTPHIVAEARWLADRTLWQGNVLAHARLQQDDGVFPNALVNQAGFRYTNWIAQAAVEAFKVRPDREALERLLPALVRNVDGIAAHFDRDGDGLLAPGDHYTTGMEFQPSFWAHVGYDNRQPQTELERPDFNAYWYGNARAVAEAARHLGQDEIAARLDAAAERTRAAVLGKLWSDEDAFFFSIRESDDAPARCKEVIGFYPFRFALPPDEPRYRAGLAALIDAEQFWTPFPVASCSKQVPVYSAAVQRWPGPGGVVTPCMWNGPTWPHAVSLAADTMAQAVRHYPGSAITPARLGELLVRFARFHCEDGDPARPLLREYGDGETGVNWGCADYMHSTFNDLLIRHAAGLLPRFDDVLEVRPLALGLGDLTIADIPYHGHRVTIALEGEQVRISVDGQPIAVGSAANGLSLTGFLR
jgi:hypothetical protein